MTVDQFTNAHPYWTALILLAVGAVPMVLWPEVSDGSRGGDASGTGRPNGCAMYWLLALSAMALCAALRL